MKKLFLFFTIMMFIPSYAFNGEVEIDGLWYSLSTDTKLATIIQSKGEKEYKGDINIPSTVEYDGVSCTVKTIGFNAFQDCSNINSVSIPNSVTLIDESAFGGCSGLKSINIPNSVISIRQSAFSNCTGLTSINLPNTIPQIELGTFAFCTSLTEISIPYGVTLIDEYAFANCRSLTSIEIPNSVIYIGIRAFMYCTSLTSVVIPDRVTTIKEGAFACCYNLKKVSIGKGIKSIDANFQARNLYLEDVYCYAEDVPDTEPSAFDYDIYKATLHVPEKSINKYKESDVWNKFGEIVALNPEETDIHSTLNDKDINSEIYTLEGKRVKSYHNGVNVIKTHNRQTRKVFHK